MKEYLFLLCLLACAIVAMLFEVQNMSTLSKPQAVAQLIAINTQLMGDLRIDVLADRQQRAGLQWKRKKIVEMKGAQ